ncbi:hypothetical protein U5B43_08765 [Campylobacter sp. 9BO]|uniref:hypothetical protein n=1 Tax=Campylobacter sp. 9BO TaxID=3424759 RepID=UPI003D325472
MVKAKKPNRKELAMIFNIPYATINDWSKAEDGNWRKNLVDFLSALSFDEINAIKSRNVKIS